MTLHSEEQLKLFLESWEDMPIDPYLRAEGADYRRRRYGSFHFSGEDLVMDPPGVFRQSEEVNSLHGGVDRRFLPLSDGALETGVLHSLIGFFLERLPGDFDSANGGVGTHQIRITTTRDENGLPAPEGVHEDGHHYVAQVLMRRDGVEGGESQLYDRDKNPLYRTTLLEPLESIVIDDRRVFQGASTIASEEDVRQGVRDMLLIDFFPVQE